MSAGRITHQMRLQAALRDRLVGQPKHGLVSSYDPDNYLVKVRLQPEDIETGWLPICVLQAGNGFGVYVAPAINDQAIVLFLEGDREVGWCAGFLPNDVEQPPHVPSGEIHVLHKDGAKLKFLAGGVVELDAAAGFNVTGPTTITGTLHTTQDITCDTTVTATTDVVGGGKHLKTHTHGGVQSGTAHTAAPD